MSRINETLKQKIDELDLDRRVNDLTEQAEVVVSRALDTAGGYARDHRSDLDRWLQRATETVEERTGGRYSDKVVRVREQLSHGVTRLAERAEMPAAAENAAPEPASEPASEPAANAASEPAPDVAPEAAEDGPKA